MIQPIPIPTLSSITPYDFSKPSSSSTHSKSSPPTAASCEYFNRSELALLCSDFLQTLFGCPTTMPSLPNSRNKSKTLAHYIAFALHRTRLSDHVAFSALLLLWKLKLLYPNAKGSSGHRLIISAMLIASKVICDGKFHPVFPLCSRLPFCPLPSSKILIRHLFPDFQILADNFFTQTRIVINLGASLHNMSSLCKSYVLWNAR